MFKELEVITAVAKNDAALPLLYYVQETEAAILAAYKATGGQGNKEKAFDWFQDLYMQERAYRGVPGQRMENKDVFKMFQLVLAKSLAQADKDRRTLTVHEEQSLLTIMKMVVLYLEGTK